MRFVRDSTGRFPKRPFYELSELEAICGAALKKHCGWLQRPLAYPLSTDFLTTLIEAHVESLDLYADLSSEGDDVEGVTDFFKGRAPRIRINKTLAEDPRREVRLRTTLAHEFCHAHVHHPLFQVARAHFDFFEHESSPTGQAVPKVCGRHTIFLANQVDWMEWQAGYVCGALLMPKTSVKDIVQKWLRGSTSILRADSELAANVADDLSSSFLVSTAAARVRLAVLGLTSMPSEQPTLFDVP